MFTLTAQNKDAASTDDYVQMPYRAGDKWGLCDTTGTVKVKPEYEAFVDMIVDDRGKKSIYYMKQKGRIIAIDHKNTQYLKEYDSINPVTSRLYKNGKTGLYEYKHANSFNKTTGNFAILAEPIYDEIQKLESWAYIIKIKGKQDCYT